MILRWLSCNYILLVMSSAVATVMTKVVKLSPLGLVTRPMICWHMNDLSIYSYDPYHTCNSRSCQGGGHMEKDRRHSRVKCG